MLVVSRAPETFRTWQPTANCCVTSTDVERLAAGAAPPSPPGASFDACIVVQCGEPTKTTAAALARVPALLKPDAPVLLLFTSNTGDDLALIDPQQASSVGSAIDAGAHAVETEFVRASWLRRTVQGAVLRLGRAARERGVPFLVLAAPVLSVLVPVSAACNRLCLRSTRRAPRRGRCSSLMLTLHRRATRNRKIPGV